MRGSFFFAEINFRRTLAPAKFYPQVISVLNVSLHDNYAFANCFIFFFPYTGIFLSVWKF